LNYFWQVLSALVDCVNGTVFSGSCVHPGIPQRTRKKAAGWSRRMRPRGPASRTWRRNPRTADRSPQTKRNSVFRMRS